MNIKDRLKQIRSITGMTQHTFADMFKIPYSTYEQWEMGIRKPPVYVIEMIETIVQFIREE